ncbi:helix-turn-helix domain-containing protein [Klebsiella pneumoniae]|uniref:helix-turn-helix domain-containing protein n=1 Tax=Klebsiella pneumoniae TaxID=573 RepID=UPI0019C80F14|nr:helix-turn-helix domain-containing protein [Klebsiella pneumoniae]MBD7683397.1 helix-turn-helix domain-containing protein [Klebsiella pneumoniae]MCI8048183.1 helix-turn-helix domain-containing protein [Klebsiella pneumoniae]MCI8053060.1 helix-turn-helix domain-containing protein [Klebsiella pneumoniae]HBQ9970649.1 helix-turn-helix domain-containing protein [Klebsiella pneumoniae]HBQ9975967.1 helix-turn-helix domain-containing protein [Klebsiella pneumoniae]
MNKQSITPEQFRAVAGTMPACRAADALGISQANFYRLAQSYSISTAFVYKPWKPEEKQIVAEMRAAGESHKSIAMKMGRSVASVSRTLSRMRKRGAQ